MKPGIHFVFFATNVALASSRSFGTVNTAAGSHSHDKLTLLNKAKWFLLA